MTAINGRTFGAFKIWNDPTLGLHLMGKMTIVGEISEVSWIHPPPRLRVGYYTQPAYSTFSFSKGKHIAIDKLGIIDTNLLLITGGRIKI